MRDRGEDGLVQVYRRIEVARTCAKLGDYAAARQGYQNVLQQINHGMSRLEDSEVAQRWKQCAAALREEQELVSACEAECEALRSVGAAPAPAELEAAITPELRSTDPSIRAVGMVFDFSAGHTTPLALTRTWCGAISHTCLPESTSAQQPDPDVWPDPPPRENTTPAGSPCGVPRSSASRVTEYERSRRASGAGCSTGLPARRRSVVNLAGVKPKINTGAKRGSANVGAVGAARGEGSPNSRAHQAVEQMLPHLSADDQDLLRQLARDIVPDLQTLHVAWGHIAGLEAAKDVLNYNVSMPLLMPALFRGAMRPSKGVLLFGPPGTGKTLLASAVACQCGTAFLTVSVSSLASKFRGDGEKFVRHIFDLARLAAPTVIFIDEIDALCSTRGASNEHEASRRLKTELLTQMDGMDAATAGAAGAEPPNVMVLAATNHPWAIDEALRRRLAKRVHIPLPGLADRRMLLGLCVGKEGYPPLSGDVDLDQVAARTRGYSGDDVKNVCGRAAHSAVQRALGGRPLSGDPAAIAQLQGDIQQRWTVSQADLLEALTKIKPSCSPEDIKRHEEFAATFGST